MNAFPILRRWTAAVSLLAMTAVFFVPAAARWCGFLPRLQLVPAILAGAALELAVLALSVVLFDRLYCSVLCPLGFAQDFFRFCFGALPFGRGGRARPAEGAASRRAAIVRAVLLVLFVLAVPFGFTGLLEPYGIFGRFLAVGLRRVGEPGIVATVWAVSLFALVLLLTFVRPRFWCSRICPVGTFLGALSRFAVFRVRLDAASCVRCGACAKRCDTGALAVRADGSVAFDPTLCIACGNCLAGCPKGALRLTGRPVPAPRLAAGLRDAASPASGFLKLTF